MKRKMIAIMLLVLTMISLCSCESKTEKELNAARQAAQEARQKANEAREELRLLETLFGK